MKINNIGASGVNPYKKQLNKLDQLSKPGQPKADKVEISTSAKEMQESLRIPKERQAKVDELKISVENGNYRVNSQEVAKSILKFYKG
ncbi:flagellar biosynthesis anti-sigma factor FlgM [Bacillus sp. AK031]